MPIDRAARSVGVPVLVSALTVVEAVYGKTDTARLRWLLSRRQVQDVTQADSHKVLSPEVQRFITAELEAVIRGLEKRTPA